MRCVVLGGFGNFGARVCRGLARDGIEVIAASRDPEKGRHDARFGADIGAARLDLADPEWAARLRALSPDLVVHCAGPFQAQDYRVATAALAAGAHYIDLADARSFVAGFSEALGPAADAAGRLAVSGASTVPGLSSAVLDALRGRFASIEEIQIAIAPGQRAPRGVATVRAVLSYAGRPFKWWKDGSWQTAHGWQALRRLRFCGLGHRWAAACDVPDLELLPARYPGVRTVEFRAALELSAQHFFLAGAAQLRRFGVPLPLEARAASLERFARLLDRFGGERGGMLVGVRGVRAGDGGCVRVEWHLTAGSNHGPEIPAMAAILLSRKLARGELQARGATPCMGLLTLDDFAAEFSRWDIAATIEERAC
ncbi:saccharopine dehydrogenase [Sulfurifustis variabilis]|uniref:Saccharopine dehydrogenase n=1 Tax=Sulfurifustis variabilis TaxID=1675686 RepID=A0A1B4V6G8_9GAMM|nr:saccharopine dehydrogenase NADP-binding domain-containing protein [Sulfurifustis variabilis]BAU49108.1 saccharopine dehydrogenase [Sulfurifustis variabilis]